MTKNVLAEKELNMFSGLHISLKYLNWIVLLSTTDSLSLWIIHIFYDKYCSLLKYIITF